MVKDPTAAVLVSNTVSLACTPYRRLTQGYGMPAQQKEAVTSTFYSELCVL